MKRLWMAMLGIVLVAVPVLADKHVEERHKVSKTASVKIKDVIGGDLKIVGWDKDEIEIVGEIGDDIEELAVDVDEHRVTIRPIIPQRGGRRARVDVHLTIKVPADASRVSVETVSAMISVAGLKDRLEAATVSGTIEVKGDMKEAHLATVSGEVISRGNINELEAASVSGDVKVYGDADEMSIANVSGGIQYSGRPTSLEVQSVSGDIRLVVPGDIKGDFEISTFSGNITNAFGQKPVKKGFGGGSELEFSTGSKSDIEVSSVSGSVRIEKQ